MGDAGLQFLTRKQSEEGPLQSQFAELAQLYQQRLWHQFSQSLLKLVREMPAASSDNALKELYDSVVKDNLELKISPLTLVEIAYSVVGKYTSLPDAKEFMQRVKGIVDQRTENAGYASCLVRIILGRIELVAKEYELVEERLNELKQFINDTPHTAQVHGRFFDVASSLYQVRGDHTNYYQNALSYLACGTEYLNLEEIQERSFNICLAALLSDGIFDMGEVLHNNIVSNSLVGSKESWVLDLVRVVGNGDLKGLEQLKPRWVCQPDLKADADWVRKKTALLALITMACEHHIEGGGVVQLDLAKVQELTDEDPERLAMKALSLGLLQGTIDQVKNILTVTWIKPRSLTTVEQLTALHQRLSSWHQASVALGDLLSDRTKLVI